MVAPLIVRPFAEQGTKTPIPQVEPNGFVNFTEGYTRYYEIALSSGDVQAKAVERSGQNYLFNILTAGLQDFQRLGLPPFYADMAGGYPREAQVVVQDGGGAWRIWRAIRDGVSSVPGTAPLDWERQQATGEFASRIPAMMGGIAAINASDPLTASSFVAPIDFNTMQSAGFWSIKLTAAANGSTNGPVYPEGTQQTQPGQLEVYVVLYGNTRMVHQRYNDSNGRQFHRARNGDSGTWTNWRADVDVSDVQYGVFNYATDTGVVNAVTANVNPPLTSRSLAGLIFVKIAVTNTGAVNINDGIGSVRLLGAAALPLTGGELVGGQITALRFDAAHNAYLIVSSSGSSQFAAGTYLPTAQADFTYDLRVVNSAWVNRNALMIRGSLTFSGSGVEDLNTATTPGIYYQANDSSATPARNYPVQLIGQLFVTTMPNVSAPSGTTHQYYDRLGGVWTRMNIGGVWGAWVQSASVAYADSINGNFNLVASTAVAGAIPQSAAGRLYLLSPPAGSTMTLPPLGGAGAKSGQVFALSNMSSSAITIATAAVEVIRAGTLNPLGAAFSSFVLNPGENITLVNTSLSYWAVSSGTGSLKFQPQVSSRTGEVAWIGHNGALPFGAIKGNGAVVSRTTYAALFALYGTTYGAGNGTTTFGLPDLRGVSPRGLDEGRGLDPSRVLGSLQNPQNMTHTHTGATDTAGLHQHSSTTDEGGQHNHILDYNTPQQANFPYQAGAFAANFNIGGAVQPYTAAAGLHRHTLITSYDGNHVHGFTTNASGGTETRVYNVALVPIIFF